VARSYEKKRVILYGKYDYYLTCIEKFVRRCGGCNQILLSKRQVVGLVRSLYG
jgi:hypothetical protein